MEAFKELGYKRAAAADLAGALSQGLKTAVLENSDSLDAVMTCVKAGNAASTITEDLEMILDVTETDRVPFRKNVALVVLHLKGKRAESVRRRQASAADAKKKKKSAKQPARNSAAALNKQPNQTKITKNSMFPLLMARVLHNRRQREAAAAASGGDGAVDGMETDSTPSSACHSKCGRRRSRGRASR